MAGPFKMKGFSGFGNSPTKQTIKEIFNKGVKGIQKTGEKIINTDIKDIPVTLIPGSPSYNDIKNLLTPEKKTGNAGKKIADTAKKILKKTKKKQAKKVDKELPGISPIKPKKKKKKKKVEAIKLPVKTPKLNK